MDEKPEPAAPQTLTQALDASVRDIQSGAINSADDVQAEVRSLLAEYERATSPPAQSSGDSKHYGAA